MKIFSIFDDFPQEACRMITDAGIELTVLAKGTARPCGEGLKRIFLEYDGIIIGTGQKMTEDFFLNLQTKKIIATASTGIDHIHIPDEKKNFVTVLNTPDVNSSSVCEYILAVLFSRFHKYEEGMESYSLNLTRPKPSELSGKTVGIIGAGSIGTLLARQLSAFDVKILQWTAHPEKHTNDTALLGEDVFVSMDELCRRSDAVVVAIPQLSSTNNFFSSNFCSLLKSNCVFVGVSRVSVYDVDSLIEKAKNNLNFSLCLDIDFYKELSDKTKSMKNVFLTPHIAGGTIEARKRMFFECAENIVNHVMN